jgi:hypothetical protein
MTRLVLPLVAALAFASGSALAQQTPASQETLTNCHTPGTTGSAPPSSSDSKSTGNAQAVEKSAILPSAGGHTESAAPTVQRDGKSVEARTDCPDDPKMTKPKGG